MLSFQADDVSFAPFKKKKIKEPPFLKKQGTPGFDIVGRSLILCFLFFLHYKIKPFLNKIIIKIF
jgi:hypothetical protein